MFDIRLRDCFAVAWRPQNKNILVFLTSCQTIDIVGEQCIMEPLPRSSMAVNRGARSKRTATQDLHADAESSLSVQILHCRCQVPPQP